MDVTAELAGTLDRQNLKYKFDKNYVYLITLVPDIHDRV